MRRKKLSRVRNYTILALALILILIASSFIFYKLEKISKIGLNQTNATTTTRPFQENISIEVPEGVVRIGRERIKTV
jgi:cell division septal protein FtsQ